jgi:hypothetical protein
MEIIYKPSALSESEVGIRSWGCSLLLGSESLPSPNSVEITFGEWNRPNLIDENKSNARKGSGSGLAERKEIRWFCFTVVLVSSKRHPAHLLKIAMLL